jgi:predicted TIM-barrel fold metal-dependent hydrolase
VITRSPLVGLDTVDAHAHLGPYSLFFIPRPGTDAMVAVMDRTGVRVAVLSANRAIQQDAHLGNSDTLAAVDAHPDRLAGYAVVNPWQDPERELDRIAGDPRFVGIKVHPSLHHYPVTGARYAGVWSFAERTGCPVLSHTAHPSEYDQPSAFDAVAERHPGARIILGHAGITPAGVDEATAVAARHPGLVLEVCGSQMTGPLIVDMVQRLGAGRVLFGSDFPFIDQRMSLGRLVCAELSAGDLRDILGVNARRLFRWRPLPNGAKVVP